jgi:D-alanine-D-alanine ligase
MACSPHGALSGRIGRMAGEELQRDGRGERIRLGVLFGGRSAEHEVSLISARSVLRALPAERYEVTLIQIDRSGQWSVEPDPRALLEAEHTPRLGAGRTALPIPVTPAVGSGELVPLRAGERSPAALGRLDAVFPILHGPLGEDGSVQGLLELAGVPFVGSGVLGSALGMDKDVQKRLLRDAGIPIAKHAALRSPDALDYRAAVAQLGTPLFVKPANMGSSIGVHRVSSEAEFAAALADAFRYDEKVLLEENVAGREIECAVLGGEPPLASVLGEVIPAAAHGYYTYEAKYLDERGAALQIPAQLPDALAQRIRELALAVFRALECSGMARVDFFVTPQQRVVVNELNTIPGFTPISMFPRLWAASGVPYAELIDRLVELALQRHRRRQQIQTK